MGIEDKVNYPQTVLQKSSGTNDSEEYLARLCERSFLSMWSFPNLYRKQGHANSKTQGTSGDGKELCDLLVVFEKNAIIFSDKYCKLPDGENVQLNWSRWYKRAVEKSAEQIRGAERWIISHPDQIFLDKSCTQGIPYELPVHDGLRIHRIVVAHGASKGCVDEYGGMGSLMLMPSIQGGMHTSADSCIPFAIGMVDNEEGYIHVFDDVTLDLVLGMLDTISDFVKYISKKEELILSNKLIAVTGEEDLLAFYLSHTDKDGEHTILPDWVGEKSAIAIEEGLWDNFEHSDTRKRQIEANKISYSWDKLIETFAYHIRTGTSYFMSHPDIREQERLLRFMAKESRTRRRMLSDRIHRLIAKSLSGQTKGVTYIPPSKDGEPLYVFLALARIKGISDEDYRKCRGELLNAYLYFAKVEFPNATDILGIATEMGLSEQRSEDLLYLDASQWDEEKQKYAVELEKEYVEKGVKSRKITMYHSVVDEYPKETARPILVGMKGNERNILCPCGSGKKFKKCCGTRFKR